ncbi:MAG: hypothetical protein CMB78_05470 [Euryarchaeota archaeon]|nr:hypothetical protein [Euryarchaeota archaeon]|tara:strand:- start:1861 stop:2835 length:975 start_codon:yes stop_codon:yes gene_type:complete
MSADPLFSTLRISTLVLCMATAARSDYETLHVRDSHWVKWAAPASLLLASELVSNNSGLSNICMVAALISAFSICFVNPPDPRKAREWGRIEASVFAFFIIGSIGVLGGALAYSDTNFVDLVLGDESAEVTLWWSLLGAILTIGFFLAAWSVGLIQGGADVKALALVALVFPSWAFMPDQMYPLGESVFRIPPAMAIFLWAGAVFLIAPPVIFLQNAYLGNIKAISDLKMAWHATKKPILEFGEGKAWVLTEVTEKDGQERVVNRILPSKESVSHGISPDQRERLSSLGIESVWVTSKHPFIVYLFFAIFPLLLIGDPLAPFFR